LCCDEIGGRFSARPCTWSPLAAFQDVSNAAWQLSVESDEHMRRALFLANLYADLLAVVIMQNETQPPGFLRTSMGVNGYAAYFADNNH